MGLLLTNKTMRSGEGFFSFYHTAYICLCIVSTINNRVFVNADTVFYSEALDISQGMDRVHTQTIGVKISFDSDPERESEAHSNFKPQRRLQEQFSIPYFTLLNSSNTIYPDLAIRASDGSSLVFALSPMIA
jgi:hypothetical protein